MVIYMEIEAKTCIMPEALLQDCVLQLLMRVSQPYTILVTYNRAFMVHSKSSQSAIYN